MHPFVINTNYSLNKLSYFTVIFKVSTHAFSNTDKNALVVTLKSTYSS